MTQSELAKLTADLLISYYDNNLQPFFDYCHEDILWLGPAKNQMLLTKKALVEAFKKEDNQLKFAVYNLSVTPVYVCAGCIDVLLTAVVDTFWPDGGSNRVYQRISFTWEIKKGQPRIRMCHISNAIDYDMRDNIYPVHYLETHPQMTLYTESSQKLDFKGVNRSRFYTEANMILYIESCGNHTLIHTASQCFESTEKMLSICNRIKENFVRCHSGFLLNPIYVKSIERFFITMTNGDKIPVPEKKYTAVKAQLKQ